MEKVLEDIEELKDANREIHYKNGSTQWTQKSYVKPVDVPVIVNTKNIPHGEDHLVNSAENVTVIHANVKMEVKNNDWDSFCITDVCKRRD